MTSESERAEHFLSQQIQSYMDTLDFEFERDPDVENQDKDTRRLVGRVVEIATSSLEGFTEPLGKRVLDLVQGNSESWRWLADDFYTREVVERIPRMVGRFTKLAPVLTGVVPSQEVRTYLREATRCYIYGFFQAAIPLCRAAIEAGLNEHLKRKLGGIPHRDLAEKIDAALRLKFISPAAAQLGHSVRKTTRVVLHERPAKERASFDALVQARGFLMELYEK